MNGAVALVTGVSSGLGAEIAFALSAGGWELVLVSRNVRRLRAVAEALPAPAHAVELDLSDAEVGKRLEAALRRVEIEPSRIALLVNNAGVGSLGPFARTDVGHLRTMQRVNVAAPMELSRWIAPYMTRAGRGVICNVASVAAFSPGPLMAEYYADKAWLRSFGLSLDAELRPYGVAVVTVCPGPFESDFHGRAGIDATRLGTLPGPRRVARRTLRAIRRRRPVVAIGLAARVWALVGPRLPWRVSRAVMHTLQRRRLEG
ncbi:MAG: SDR family NAD(P)-dependent oxidoreductase [Spirochaetales bacterium]|nr:SDR family NAD(P)-dependent oxidoreductase [Spirochaetales bacterium]